MDYATNIDYYFANGLKYAIIYMNYMHDNDQYDAGHNVSTYMQQIRLNIMIRDENKLFLVGYCTDSKNRDTFTVCNTDKHGKMVKVVIEQNHKSEELRNTIRCNCSDYRFRCYKNNIICKHCIFILNNVAKMNSEQYVIGRKITDIALFNVRILNMHVVKFNNTSITVFKNSDKEIDVDDKCPICLDDLDSNNKEILSSCPTCKNYVHTECIVAWLRNNDKCVFCRSDVWKQFLLS